MMLSEALAPNQQEGFEVPYPFSDVPKPFVATLSDRNEIKLLSSAPLHSAQLTYHTRRKFP
jgi:hypothetical protein